MEDILFTVKEASKLLKTDEPTVRKLIEKGILRALKLGRLKVRKVEIERFLGWAEGKDLNDLDDIKDLNYVIQDREERLKCVQ
ncbi:MULTISPECIES: helix-turn-helix domain-containing protein [unclassified Clostridium]|uniref:helix-turn-helix domain-containing protein n=1 Tax=unclassified Clostridium TaxID=2614128 RepID=UPI0013F0EBD0|nr:MULTISPECIES: helix-turn-helix domain-containing protein [unclassified Clostridium]NFH89140.1 helix-turn-helix domain-containing protein [Clostridium botulinum]NFI17070.1 helix-turn-helix domain-containing protein [Clostridium botulinum]NFL92004.1 helix-turn-helix domain-containing protein [Clostridium botulinum]NFN51265.1 helix-turn-helix domain-containing protein [Clostridium botulinum]NFO26474.1 helix-turn-helix domain-containing protein [Clostridium botulinum]